MPNLGPTVLAKLRKNRHSLRLFCSFFPGTTVAQATVSATPGTYPVSSLAMTITSGSHTNIERGMEVVITSSTGAPKGRLRVRASGTLNATTLPIAEVSQASVTIVSGDILKVLSEHRIRPKFPKADETFAPDWLTYGDQNSAIPPMALSGGPICTFVDAGETYATIDFDGTDSYAADPDSGGTLTHAWTFPSGSTPTSSTSATPTGVEIPVGEWWIKHTVTDSSNSKTWTQYIPVWVHDADNLPYDVQVQSLSGTLADGWTATFGMLDAISLENIPDRCMVVLWAKEIIDQEEQSFGGKSRSENKFVGWLRSDEASSNAQQYTLSLTAISAMAVLGEIYGSSKVMLSETSPGDWSEIDDLSVKLGILQILRWYTTLTEICDVALDDFTDYIYPRFYLQKNTPLEAVKELADSVDARFACDRRGRLEIQLRPELTPRADRNSIPTTLTIQEQDVIAINLRREHHRPVDLLEVRGIRYDADIPLFSRYPGNAPGEGSQNTVQDKLIAANQSDLNKRAGLRGAHLDRVYIDLNGISRHAPSMQVVLFGSYDVFDFYREWIAVNIDESSNRRGIALNDFRWMLQGVQVEYQSGTATLTLDLQAETAAPDGVTYIPPTPPDNQIPASDWTLPPMPPTDDDVVFTGLVANIVAVTANGHLFQTTNFTATTPTWTDRNISASLSSTNVLLFAVDPRSPLYQGTGATVNGWIITDTGVDYVSDLFSATPSVSNQLMFPLVTTAVGFDVDYTSEPGRYAIAIYRAPLPSTGNRYECSFWDGSSWQQGDDLSDSTVIPAGFLGVSIDPHSAGLTYAFRNSGGRLLMYGTHGVNWNPDDDPYLNVGGGSLFGTFLYMPFAQNPVRYIFYHSNESGDGLYRGDLDSDRQWNITPTISGNSYTPSLNAGHSVVSCPSGDKNRVMYVGQGASGTAVFLSNDAMGVESDDWTVVHGPTSDPRYLACAMTDPDGSGAYLWGERDIVGHRSGIGFWNGTTVLDKRGTTFTTSKVVGIAGG